MEKIMTIKDIRDVPGKGLVIGGTNSKLDDLTPKEIEQKIADYIELRCHSSNSVRRLSVLGVNVTESIIGKKNLFILLGKIDFDIRLGSDIFPCR